jgi:hypothetical protein
MPSNYAAQITAEHQAAGNLGAAEQQMPRAMPSDYAVASRIESIRAAQPA